MSSNPEAWKHAIFCSAQLSVCNYDGNKRLSINDSLTASIIEPEVVRQLMKRICSLFLYLGTSLVHKGAGSRK
jgi:hypothetical protein